MTLTELVEFWRQYPPGGGLLAHPDDLPVLQKDVERYVNNEPIDFDTVINSPTFGEPNDNRFRMSLKPLPYGGDLYRAEVVILLLNPGFSYADYYAENDDEYVRRLSGNLRQEFADIEFPFLWLDPAFCWTAGYIWWEKKLRKIVRELARRCFAGNYVKALRHTSQRLAHIELVPYHSSSFNAYALLRQLVSVRMAQEFARDVLFSPTAATTVVVTRQAAQWAPPRDVSRVIVYDGAMTRGASLGPMTPGGAAILERLVSVA
jgi:hypothetical protein